MSQIQEQKCPACGGPARFDPGEGLLVCDYCGTKTRLEANEPSAKADEKTGVEGFDFDSLNDLVSRTDAAELPVYNCVSCGAEVLAPAEQAALTCPYCGNNIVLTDKLSGSLRPDAVIPFRIEAKELPAAVNRFYKGRKLLPRRFFSEHTMGRVTGVYVPFWVFDGTVRGELTFDAENRFTERRGDYLVTKTDHYLLSRRAELAFDGLPVDASEKLDDALMDSLEPFDLTQAQPFDPRWLAGFAADRFDVAKRDIAARAEKRMKNTAEGCVTAAAQGGYNSVRWRGGTLKADLRARYMLFPVYVFDILYGGKTQHYAVNGQTGKVVGELPTSRAVNAGWFLLRAGIVAGAVLLFSLVKYLMGR